ncbi:MAG: UDP-3-O-acyl-N-acetylglucosamine deacetylase, partial [Planctomycetota bacterium]
MKRQQLSGPTAAIEGRGIHTGEPSRLRVLPAPPGSGLRFCRTDLDGSLHLGREDLVRDSAEGGRTALRRGEVAVQTVEHVAAAIWGMGLDDALVELEGPEPPAADGSALPFVQALQAAGIEETGDERPVLRPRGPLVAEEGSAAVTCLPVSSGTTLRYCLDYAGQPLARGSREMRITPESFASEIAPARTFCTADQVDRLLAMGWGKGADTSNTLVLEGESVRDNQLRFDDEPVRHKLLDMVGDLAFVGGELVASVRGSRSGHSLNRKMLDKILAVCEVGN